MVKIRKLNIYNNPKDRELIEKLPCSFCGEHELKFSAAYGYESRFEDSDFVCSNCGCSYAVGLFFPDTTIEECKEMMRKRALGYYDQLRKDYEEKLGIVNIFKKKLEMFEDNFNPSKRGKRGRSISQ